MSANPRPRRRIHVPAIEREFWRRAVFDEIFGRDDVRTLIEDELKPLYQSIEADWQAISDEGHEARMMAYERMERGERLSSQVTFEDALYRFTAKKVRCLSQGKPAYWVAAYVKTAAMDNLPDGPFWPDPGEAVPDYPDRDLHDSLAFYDDMPLPRLQVDLTFKAGPYGTVVHGSAHDSRTWFGPEIHQETIDESGTWDDWDAFADFVSGLARDFVRVLQREYKRRNPTSVNVAVDEQRQQDVRALVGYLVDRQRLPADRAKRERLRKFARLVGLDFPVSSDRDRSTKKRAKTIIIPVRR